MIGVDSWIPQTIWQWIPDCWSATEKVWLSDVLWQIRGTDSWQCLADTDRQ